MRSNIGNITTNAIQTMAISGTTAAQMKQYNADKRLNNTLSGRNIIEKNPEMAEKIGQANAQRQLDEANKYLSYTPEERERLNAAEKIRNTERARQAETGFGVTGINMSDKQQSEYAVKRDEALAKRFNEKEDEEGDVVSSLESTFKGLNSPQEAEIIKNLSNNLKHFQMYTLKNKQGDVSYLLKSKKEKVGEVEENADV